MEYREQHDLVRTGFSAVTDSESSDTESQQVKSGDYYENENEGGEEADDESPWNARTVRLMENGDIAIPWSMAFVIKRMDNFDIHNCSMDCRMTMIMRIKFTGLANFKDLDQMKEVMKECKTNLKVRVHEEEATLVQEPSDKKLKQDDKKKMRTQTYRSGQGKEVTSFHYEKKNNKAVLDAGVKDMLQFTLRVTEELKTDFKYFGDYPFDQPIFEYRFEISHFQKKWQGNKIEYRFDFFEQSNNSISFKKNCDLLPELDIDYNIQKPILRPLQEEKPHEMNGVKGKCLYYPGFTFVMRSIRDPVPKLIRIGVPVSILGVFLYATFDIEEYHEKLANLAICLLTFIGIMEDMRRNLPDISMVTSADMIIIIYIILSLLPILDHIVFRVQMKRVEEQDKEEREQFKFIVRMIYSAFFILSTLYSFYKWIRARYLLNQTVPEQEKGDGSKVAADKYWLPLQDRHQPSWVAIDSKEEQNLIERKGKSSRQLLRDSTSKLAV